MAHLWLPTVMRSVCIELALEFGGCFHCGKSFKDALKLFKYNFETFYSRVQLKLKI